MAPSRPFKEDHQALPLPTPLRDAFGSVSAGSVSSSATRQIFQEESHLLVLIAWPASLSARSFFVTPACPGQYIHRRFRRWMSFTTRKGLGEMAEGALPDDSGP